MLSIYNDIFAPEKMLCFNSSPFYSCAKNQNSTLFLIQGSFTQWQTCNLVMSSQKGSVRDNYGFIYLRVTCLKRDMGGIDRNHTRLL